MKPNKMTFSECNKNTNSVIDNTLGHSSSFSQQIPRKKQPQILLEMILKSVDSKTSEEQEEEDRTREIEIYSEGKSLEEIIESEDS